MAKTIKLSIFWAANSKNDKSYFRNRPAPEIAREHMGKAHAILKTQGFAVDVQPAGALAPGGSALGHEIAEWTTPIAHDIQMYMIMGFAKAGPVSVEKRLPVIFCSFEEPITLIANKPPYVLFMEEMTLGVTVIKELNEKDGIFFASGYPPFVLMNTRMNAPNSSKLGALAHEIVHAAGVRHVNDQDNLMYPDANKAGEALTKDQVKKLGGGYFVA